MNWIIYGIIIVLVFSSGFLVGMVYGEEHKDE
jgi:hypothetical protein